MATITIENVPETFAKKVWKKVNFDSIIWLYWDGMDWCQYDEVIPSKEDIDSYNSLNKKNILTEEEFFSKIMN